MQLENRFTIPIDTARAWDVLLDVRRVVPCFPGAAVTSVVDDTIEGSVRIKLGPVLLHYAGTAQFVEKDQDQRRVVLTARGSDRKGGGSAAATITAALHQLDGFGTECTIRTDLDITGRPAQFGRGIMTEVGNRITDQFAANLSAMLTAPGATELPTSGQLAAAGAVQAHPSAEQGRPGGEPKPLDLLRVARRAAAKRAIPVLVGLIAAVAAILTRRARRSSRLTQRHGVHS